jgi:hypothetical protein
MTTVKVSAVQAGYVLMDQQACRDTTSCRQVGAARC